MLTLYIYGGEIMNKLYKNKANIILILLFTVFACMSIYFEFIPKLPEKNDVHFNLLTISTVFSGFLFTSLGILIGFIDKANMPDLESAGFVGQYFNGILTGIALFLISVATSLVLIILKDIPYQLKLYNLEVFTLLGGITFFIKAVIDVFAILRKVRMHIREDFIKRTRK